MPDPSGGLLTVLVAKFIPIGSGTLISSERVQRQHGQHFLLWMWAWVALNIPRLIAGWAAAYFFGAAVIESQRPKESMAAAIYFIFGLAGYKLVGWLQTSLYGWLKLVNSGVANKISAMLPAPGSAKTADDEEAKS